MRASQLSVLLLVALSIAGAHFKNRVKAFSAPQTSSLNEISLATAGGASDDFGCKYDGRVQLTTFGNVRSAGGEALPETNLGGDSRFQGMWKDAGTGLYYVRARYYDPKTGRFLSRDPAQGRLGQPESFMPYVFANSNPYVFRDPTGSFSLYELELQIAVRINLATSAAGSTGVAAAAKFANRLRGIRDAAFEAFQRFGSLLPRFGSQSSNVLPQFGTRSVGAGQYLGRVIQTGGRTLGKRTARILNETLGYQKHPREWGRALEALKRDLSLPNNHHGRITDIGNYVDEVGNILGNLTWYL